MRHRVRLDLSFASESDAIALMNYAKTFVSKASSLNEGRVDAEISCCDYELCRHDEGKPCTKVERVEVKGGKVVEIVKATGVTER